MQFMPVTITHPVFLGPLARLRWWATGTAFAAAENGADSAAVDWVWDHEEQQRVVLEDLFFQLATGEPPFAVRMSPAAFLFNRAPQTEPTPPQVAMVDHWNAKARAHALPESELLDARELAACGEWTFVRTPAPSDAFFIGAVPVVLSVCAQWHLQDCDFRGFAAALVATLPGRHQAPGAWTGAGAGAGHGKKAARLPQPAGFALPSRHSAVPFIAAFVADRFPEASVRVRKAATLALHGMLFDPALKLNLVYTPDLPLCVTDIVASTQPAARDLARVYAMLADNRWTAGSRWAGRTQPVVQRGEAANDEDSDDEEAALQLLHADEEDENDNEEDRGGAGRGTNTSPVVCVATSSGGRAAADDASGGSADEEDDDEDDGGSSCALDSGDDCFGGEDD